jgi:hypothetical protein
VGTTITAAESIISKPAVEHPTARHRRFLLKGDSVRTLWEGSHGDEEEF